MRDTLILHLSPSESDEAPICQWKRVQGDATATSTTGTCELREILEDFAGERLIVFVASENISLKQVDLPVRQVSKLQMAVPYALEDQLAADVSQLHFALGSRQAGGITPVAIASHEQMTQWLSLFQECGVQPDLMIPDVLALPWSNEQVTVYVEESGRCLVRNAQMAGFAAPMSLLPQLLPNTEENALFLLQNADTQLPEGYSVGRSQSAASLLDALSDFSDSAFRINLLQGLYAPKRATQQWLRAARWPTALAASWVVLSSILVALENHQKEGQYTQLQDQAMVEFSAAFPATTRIVDMKVQAAQELERLKSGSSDDGFMKLLSDTSPALGQVAALKVESLQFRDGSLYISLSGSDLQALELLRAEFQKISTLKLDVQSAQAGTDGVQIRLKVDQA
ncbi:MAG: type II secretion system protein GspL [Oceanococcus sp.]